MVPRTNINPTGVTNMRLGVQRSVPLANPCLQGTFCYMSYFFLKIYCGSFFLLVEALHLHPGINMTMINSHSQSHWYHQHWQAIKTWQNMCAIVIHDRRSLWEILCNVTIMDKLFTNINVQSTSQLSSRMLLVSIPFLFKLA